MARKFLTPIDMGWLEVLNLRVQNLAAAPAHSAGRIYYDTVLGCARVSTGAAWVNLDAALDTEAVQDIVGTFITGAAPIMRSYNDATNTLLLSLADEGIDANYLADNAVITSKIVDGAVSQLKLDPTLLAFLLSRSNHTDTQPHTTISDFDSGVQTNRLDQMALPTSALNLNNQRLINLATPVSDTDAATKAYADSVAQGLTVKEPVRVTTTASITLSGTQTIDGVALVAGDRVLVRNQADTTTNGIYIVAAGAWTVAPDFPSGARKPGTFVFVTAGTLYADTGWVNTADATAVANTWAQFSSAGVISAGNGLTKTGNSIDVVAGTGISVAADSVSVNTAVVVRKYASTLSTSATSYVVTHNLNTQDVTVQVYLNSGTFEEVDVDVEHTSVNTITLRFATAPTANAYRVVVHG